MEQVVPSTLQRLRAADIIHMAGLTVASLGQEYSRTGMVHNLQRQGARLSGAVDVPRVSAGIAASPTIDAAIPAELSQRHYIVEVEIQNPTAWKNTCSCSPNTTTLCPHAAALLYQWLARPTAFVVVGEEEVKDLSAEIGNMAGTAHLAGVNRQGGTSPTATSRQGKHGVAGLTATRSPARLFTANKPIIMQHGPMPLASSADILSQTGLSELRTIAREFEVATNGLSKHQVVEALLETLRQPETVRRMAATLEKPQRQLLAALVLAGRTMTDEDLRGVFERFALGPPGQFQDTVMMLQGKGLLFRTSLNDPMQPRVGVGGTLLDVGWCVPAEVRSALHATVPITPFPSQDAPTIQQAEPYALLADLLLAARALDGYRLEKEDEWDEQSGRSAATRSTGTSSSSRLTGSLAADGSMTLLPSGALSASLLSTLQTAVSRPPAFLHFAVYLLRLADILYKDHETSSLRILPNAAELLLGPTHTEVAHDLFELWLAHTSAEELFALQEDGLRLRCRTTSLNYPLLRPGELEAENSEARQAILALLAQVPLDTWINFPVFARFVYRLNPLFLQKRQRLFSMPHWWIEQEEGHPLQPLQSQDWLRAEFVYLTRLLCGPLHWWGICDLALADDGRLLAFRLTPLAGRLLNGIASDAADEEPQEYDPLIDEVEVVDTDNMLIPCRSAVWPLLQVIESFAQAAGVRNDRLCYRLAPQSLSEAMSRGQHPAPLLDLLRTLIPADARSDDPLLLLLMQLERWTASYGRVRFYTDAVLLEVADTTVARELTATTSLDEQVVRMLQPTLFILKRAGAAHMIDDLKRRGQTPLLHDEDVYGAE